MALTSLRSRPHIFDQVLRRALTLHQEVIVSSPFPMSDAGMSGLPFNELGSMLKRGLERREQNLASDYEMEIQRQLEAFREEIADGAEVVLEVVLPGNCPAEEVYHVGYVNPNMLLLHCIGDEGDLSRILVSHAHVTLRLRATPGLDEPRKPIGFMAQPTDNSRPSGERPTG